jgi:hypothetical protein
LTSVATVADPVEGGDVVAIDPERPDVLRLARTAGDTGVFGVVSTAAGERLDPEIALEPSVHRVPVAVGGVVTCKVDAGYGAIRPGDLLTTSSTAGHAMRALEPLPGTVLGKALEPWDVGTGVIRVLIQN